MKKISILKLIISLCIPLLVGGISAVLSSDGMAIYAGMNKPPLSPPAWVFSVAWTILYLMMGLAAYLIMVSKAEFRSKAMAFIFYGIQLTMNFAWSILFFNMKMYLVAFIWLVVMLAIVVVCAFRFYSINRMATLLFVPYIMWLVFAAYLNMGAYMLNMS